MLSPFAALRVNFAKHLEYLLENKPRQTLREVYPERESEILRFAQSL
jgi:hypothetical protein